MYHPAAALRTPAIERESYADIAAVPSALIDARRRREATPEPPTEPEAPETTDAPDDHGRGRPGPSGRARARASREPTRPPS